MLVTLAFSIRGGKLTFIDSDDYVLPCHFSYLADKHWTIYDLCSTGVKGVKEESVESNEINNASTVTHRNLRKFFAKENIKEEPTYLVTNKCFKTDIIKEHNIRFREDVSLGENQIFVCEYLMQAQTWCRASVQSYCVFLGSNDGLTSKQ